MLTSNVLFRMSVAVVVKRKNDKQRGTGMRAAKRELPVSAQTGD